MAPAKLVPNPLMTLPYPPFSAILDHMGLTFLRSTRVQDNCRWIFEVETVPSKAGHAATRTSSSTSSGASVYLHDRLESALAIYSNGAPASRVAVLPCATPYSLTSMTR